MTLFKDPNSYNYAFYGAIIVLAVIGSLFFGEPASPEHLTNKSEEFIETHKERLKYHKFYSWWKSRELYTTTEVVIWYRFSKE